jgi:hypothetical protein
MRNIIRFRPEQCIPQDTAILRQADNAASTPVTTSLIEQAKTLFRERATPVAVRADITVPEFAPVFAGEGLNAPDAPLEHIFPKAGRLALFACTIGGSVTEHILLLFDKHDYALGYMLDALASCGADKLADLVQDRFSEVLQSAICNLESAIVLRYSPGYCGWHVSAQRRLFEFLKPEEIGITLRESFLMEPLKSVSGVFVVGPAAIHRFEPGFSFCADCRSPTCRERLAPGNDPIPLGELGSCPKPRKE